MAPRVTRAAAAADPVLANETQRVVEDALAEPATGSPSKQGTTRPALGEITINDTPAPTAASIETAAGSLAELAASGDENIEVVLSVGTSKDGKKADSKTISGRKSTKKAAKARASRGGLKNEFNRTLNAWSERKHGISTMGKTRAKSYKKQSLDNVIILEDGTASRSVSDASAPSIGTETAADVIDGYVASSGSRIPYLIRWTGNPARTLEPGIPANPDPFQDSLTGHDTYFYADIDASHDDPVLEKKSEVVQKLCSMFEPPTREEEASLTCTLPVPRASPIEAMDAFEKELEAVEDSLDEIKEMQKATPTPLQSKRVSTNMTPRTKSVPTKPSTASAPKVISAAPRRSIAKFSPTSIIKVRKPASAPMPVTLDNAKRLKRRSEIAALNTPPRAIKSTKPLTVSSFRLHGEAVAAKHRAAKEEREKRREEEERKKKDTLKNRKPYSTIRPISKPRPSIVAPQTLARPAPPQFTIGTLTAATSRPSIASRVNKLTETKTGIPPTALRTARNTANSSSSAKSSAPHDKAGRAVPAVTAIRTSQKPSMTPANTSRSRMPPAQKAISNTVAAAEVEKRNIRKQSGTPQLAELVKGKVEEVKRVRDAATLNGKATAERWAAQQGQKDLLSL